MIELASSPALEPFFLNSRDRQLFASFHLPIEPARDCGVVICYPIWQEYIRSHRACLNLAKGLARAGFPSLRFDYFGSGDSSGDAPDATLDHWKADIRASIDELRERSGVSTISLVGLRLGASLAAAVAAECGDIASLVLWDPVVNGQDFIQESISLQQNTIRFFFAQPKHGTVADRPTELLGFPINPGLLEGIETIDLLAAECPRAPRLLIIESHTGEPAQRLAARLKLCSARVDYRHIPSFKIWTEHTDKGLVPTNVLSAILSWLSEVHG